MSTVSDVLESYARDWAIDATPLISVMRSPSAGTLGDVSIPSERIREDLVCFLEALVAPRGDLVERQSEARSLLAEITRRLTLPEGPGGAKRPLLWTYGTTEALELTRREIARRLDSAKPNETQPTPEEPANRALTAIKEIAAWLQITPTQAADLAGGYRRSYYNWLKGMVPYEATTLNLFEAHSFVAALVDAIEPRGAREWLRVPYGNGARLDLLRDNEGRATLSRLARSVIFTTPDSAPEWLPDDELTHTPPPRAPKNASQVRRVQRPKKGYKK
ncbi:hypothetical protein [Streptomyces diastatochromogenes]|uniref:hypothetical protein n=1 Tax=Streptomyces diastatochromogenes TaxID=42236 RepID=UPI003689351F